MLKGRTQETLSNPRLGQVVQVAEAVGVSKKLNDGRKGMSLEDIPYGHVVVVESISSEEGCGWASSNVLLHCFSLFFAVGTHLSGLSVDGLEVFFESTVVSNHVKDGSVALLALEVVVVMLVNDRELIGSYD